MKFAPTVLLLAVPFLNPQVFAQDSSGPAFSGAEISTIQITAGSEASLLGGAGQLAPIVIGNSLDSFSVNPGDKSQLFQLLNNDSVRQELQLSEAQLEGVRNIAKESSQRLSTLVQEMLTPKNPGEQRSFRLDRTAMAAITAENNAQAEMALEEILLPRQLERIRQLAYQIEVAEEGLGAALTTGRLGAEIEVHENQKQHLLDRAREIDNRLKIELAKLHSAARAELLAELTPDQRKAAEERLGNYFAYEHVTLGQTIRNQLKRMQPPSKED